MIFKPKRLLWKVYTRVLGLAVTAVLATTWYASHTMRASYYREKESELTAAARLIANQIEREGVATNAAAIDDLCKSLGGASGYRITALAADGRVLGDSDEDPGVMDNHGNRREVLEARRSGHGMSMRYSETLSHHMMYVAIPLPPSPSADARAPLAPATVRVSLPLSELRHALTILQKHTITVGIATAIIAVLASLALTRRISQALDVIRVNAEAIGQGKLTTRIPPSEVEEIDVLAETVNTMAGQLHDRIRTITRQRDERDALLASMTEGVIAVDARNCILNINRAAAELFGLDAAKTLGRGIPEVIRNVDLLRVLEQSAENRGSIEGDVLLPETGRFLQAHISVLHDSENRQLGALIVLNDVTRLRKLETMRRDLVANVSHELKTPITSIRGFAETLRDGAAQNPDELKRFIGIICRHANRLQAIVEDLLTLSSLEHSVDRHAVEIQPARVAAIIERAVQSCRAAAELRRIRIEASCPPALEAMLNPTLVEHAIANLLDNAVKYSETDTTVRIEAVDDDGNLVVCVRDEGPGIDRVHLDRIFERFYRVDKGRSRGMGGTGLGLAIVKHVAVAHGGTVNVKSEPGHGSTFTIRLPRERKTRQSEH